MFTLLLLFLKTLLMFHLQCTLRPTEIASNGLLNEFLYCWVFYLLSSWHGVPSPAWQIYQKCVTVQGQRLVLHFHSLLPRLTENFTLSFGNSTTAWNPETCPDSLSTSGSKYTSMVMALERELLAIRYSHTMYRPTDFSHLYLIMKVTTSLSMNFGTYLIYREFFSQIIKLISLFVTPMLEIACGSTVLSLRCFCRRRVAGHVFLGFFLRIY